MLCQCFKAISNYHVLSRHNVFAQCRYAVDYNLGKHYKIYSKLFRFTTLKPQGIKSTHRPIVMILYLFSYLSNGD